MDKKISLDKDERRLITSILEQHLKEISAVRALPNIRLELFVAESTYESFVKRIMRKIK